MQLREHPDQQGITIVKNIDKKKEYIFAFSYDKFLSLMMVLR